MLLTDMTRAEIRRQMKASRRALAPDVRARASAELSARLLARVDIRAALAARTPIAVYLASPEELDLSSFIRVGLTQGGVFVAPRWTGVDYELVPLTDLSSATLVQGPHGIWEPRAATPVSASAVGVWLIPGLAFTRQGGRLGFGGGWYDRLLAGAAPSALKLGLAYDFQLLAALPLEPHDQPLTEVLTLP